MTRFCALTLMLVLGACSAPYESVVQVDPMTGETTRRANAVRLDPVQGHTTFGQQFATGSSARLTMSSVVIAETWISFQASFVSDYSAGMVGGQARVCVDESVRMNIDGELYEFAATGAVQSTGLVTERTWGQASAGAAALTRSFLMEGDAVPAFMASRSVLIEYCDIVSAIHENSLAELQGRTDAAEAAATMAATEFANLCDQGDAAACYQLGRCFMAGTRGVRQNTGVACSAFTAACEGGDPDGCNAFESECGR